MKKLLGILVLGLLLSSNAYANKNKNTWDYPLIDYRGWVIRRFRKSLQISIKFKKR